VASIVSVVCAGCVDTVGRGERFVLKYEGMSGVWRVDDSSFRLLVYPCGDALVSRVELNTYVRDDGAIKKTSTLLRVTYDPPVSSRRVLASTAVDAPVVNGERREVLDEENLRRFNEDDTYLASFNPDEYVGFDAWDGEGVEMAVGGNLYGRFGAAVGEVRVPDYPGGSIDRVVCPDGSQAWQP
jgi:hypothetical protein